MVTARTFSLSKWQLGSVVLPQCVELNGVACLRQVPFTRSPARARRELLLRGGDGVELADRR